MEPFYRRHSSHVCVDFGSPPSETGGWSFGFGAFQQIYAVYGSRRLRGWNHFTGGTLVPFASTLVLLQPKREGGDYVWSPFNKFMLCMILTGCAGEIVYGRLSRHVCVDLSSPPSETGGWGLCFGAFQQIYPVYDSRRLRGWNRFTGGSLVTFASILVRLQAKWEGGDYVWAPFNKFML